MSRGAAVITLLIAYKGVVAPFLAGALGWLLPSPLKKKDPPK